MFTVKLKELIQQQLTHPPNNVHTKVKRTYPNQIELKQIHNPRQQLTHPTNNVHTKDERTYPNQIEQMQIDNPRQQLTHPPNNVHDLMPNINHTKDGRMKNVTHSPPQVSNMYIDISPQNHLPNQGE